MLVPGVNALETADWETPANRATSYAVIRCRLASDSVASFFRTGQIFHHKPNIAQIKSSHAERNASLQLYDGNLDDALHARVYPNFSASSWPVFILAAAVTLRRWRYRLSARPIPPHHKPVPISSIYIVGDVSSCSMVFANFSE